MRKYKIVLFTLGNVKDLGTSCKASLYSEVEIAALSKRSQEFYDCLALNFEIVAWGCGRHPKKTLDKKNSLEYLDKISEFYYHLEAEGIEYDLVIQMGCHPHYIHSKPYFIYTDSGLSPQIDLSELDQERFPKTWVGANIDTDIYKDIFAKATAVFTMSPLTSFCLSKVNGVEESKIVCVGAEAVKEMKEYESPFQGEKINVLWVGSDIENKNPQLVIEAVCRLKERFSDLELVLLGIQPDHLGRQPEYIHIYPFTDDLKFLEQQYAKADIFVLPSYREAFGLVYIEAMAHNTVVLVSSRSGFASVVEQERIGKVIAPDALHDLIEMMTEIIEQKEEAIEIANRGYQYVALNCTQAILSSRIAEVILDKMEENS